MQNPVGRPTVSLMVGRLDSNNNVTATNIIPKEDALPSSTLSKDNDDEPHGPLQNFVNKPWVRSIHETAGKIVQNDKFQFFIVLLILVNAIMMGVATFNFVSESPSVSNAFEQTDRVFLILFTIELFLQFCHHGLRLFTDGWLVFDFCIVFMSWSLDSIQIVRTFRIFRALRMVTRVALLRNLVMSLIEVLPRMTALNMLLLLVFYVFAVMCTILFGDLYERGLTEADYFSRLDNSFWTLFAMMTLDWAEVARQVMKVYPHSWPIFLIFVFISSFIGYNLMIAIVCDSVKIIDQLQKKLAAKDGIESDDEAGDNQDDKDNQDDEDDNGEADSVTMKARRVAKVQDLQDRVSVLQARQERILKLMKTAVHDLQRQRQH